MENLTKQVQFLKIYAFVLTLVIAGLTFMLFSKNQAKEITVERINIVEPDGRLKMVISNRQNQHPGMVDGKVVAKRDRSAGLIFFNDVGDECGGLIYNGDKQNADMTYSVDQFKNDQLMQLQYSQTNSHKPERSYGFKLWDRSDSYSLKKLMHDVDSLKKLNATAYEAGVNQLKSAGKLGVERLFLGKNKAGEVGLFLKDADGKPRIKIYINTANEPVVAILDENEKVVNEVK